MYQIEVFGPEGLLARVPYDPDAGVFGDANTPPLPETIRTRLEELRGEKTRGVLLRLFTSHACNMRCAYCYQPQDKAYRPADGDLHKLCDALMWYYRTLRASDDAPLTLDIIGGEPLLYWRELKTVILDLERRVPEFHAQFVTNGTLFTGEVANFCLRHGVHVTFSHDGPGQPLRGVDPLAAGRESARAIRYYVRNSPGKAMAVSCTLTRGHFSARAVRQYLREKMPDTRIVIVDAPVCRGDGERRVMYGVSQEEMGDYFQSLVDTLTSEPIDLYSSYFSLFKGLYAHLYGGREKSPAQTCFAYGSYPKVVTWEGNLLNCIGPEPGAPLAEGVPNYMGNLFEWMRDDWTADDAKAAKRATIPVMRAECSTCIVAGACNGVCPALSEEAAEAQCEARFHTALAVWSAFLKTLWPEMVSFELKR